MRRSERFIAVGAVALLVFLFLFKWYGGSFTASLGGLHFSSSANGWHTFTDSRWIWLVTSILALGAVALRATQRELGGLMHPGVVIAWLGGLSMLLILYRIVHHPISGVSASTVDGVHYSSTYGIKVGIWLALIAAALIAYGGYLAMQAEASSPSEAREQAPSAFSGL